MGGGLVQRGPGHRLEGASDGGGGGKAGGGVGGTDHWGCSQREGQECQAGAVGGGGWRGGGEEGGGEDGGCAGCAGAEVEPGGGVEVSQRCVGGTFIKLNIAHFPPFFCGKVNLDTLMLTDYRLISYHWYFLFMSIYCEYIIKGIKHTSHRVTHFHYSCFLMSDDFISNVECQSH